MLWYFRLCLLTLPLSAWLAAQPLLLEPAAEISVATEAGKLYQIELSSDLNSWAPWGPWILGDGAEHVRMTPLDGEPAYFRVTESPVADLTAGLTTLLAQTGVPGLAAVVLQNGQVTGIGAVGQRRVGAAAPVMLTDKWHHGSMTKSMTATLAAILVKEGLIDWTTTLGEVFPEKVGAMASGWSDVTLKHLLANSGGAPGDLNANGIWTKLWNFQGLPVDGRDLLIDEVTTDPLRYPPGTGYEYSNAGFSMAGAMLEKVAGLAWEELIREKLFTPLGMVSAGVGVPATPRHLDQPIGHSGVVTNPAIWDPGTSADNPPAIGPAATVHASIIDYARYVQLHLQGGAGVEGLLLDPASFDVLHDRAYGYDYALGWNVLSRGFTGGDALQHTGSNTQWYTNTWIAPEVGWACAVSINFGGTQAFNKTDAVVLYLLSNFGP